MMCFRFYRLILICVSMVATLACIRTAQAQAYTETVLYNFCGVGGTACTDGSLPFGGVVQGKDGNFYGTTAAGGVGSSVIFGNGNGTVFKITPAGALTTLHDFCTGGGSCTDGTFPGALVLGSDGNFYGTTQEGGAASCDDGLGCGTVFQITPTGTFTTLHTFCSVNTSCPDGFFPSGKLAQGADGNFYGVTLEGGTDGVGTLFRITPSGSLTTLAIFQCDDMTDICADGAGPNSVIQGSDGNFYGTAGAGGTNGGGTVFKLSGGTLTALYNFCSQGTGNTCTDGTGPNGLVQGTDGSFYGGSEGGGFHSSICDVAEGFSSCGNIFKITPSTSVPTSYAYTILHTFCSQGGTCTDGGQPFGALIEGKDGNFYGNTLVGGLTAGGTTFKVTPSGTLTTIHSFGGTTSSNCASDGIGPIRSLVQGTDGNFYGTTQGGGTHAEGTIFSITVAASKENASATLSSSPIPLSVGQTLKLDSVVTGQAGIPTGSLTLSLGGTNLVCGVLNDGSFAFSINTNGILPGTYPILGTYAGSFTYNGVVAPVDEVVLQPAPTSTTLTASPNPVNVSKNLTLVATVKRTASGAIGTATGKVSFYYLQVEIGSANLNGSGAASIVVPTTGLPTGKYNLTALYGGDSFDVSSTSAVVPVTVQ